MSIHKWQRLKKDVWGKKFSVFLNSTIIKDCNRKTCMYSKNLHWKKLWIWSMKHFHNLYCKNQNDGQRILSSDLTIMLAFDCVPYLYQIDHRDLEFTWYLFFDQKCNFLWCNCWHFGNHVGTNLTIAFNRYIWLVSKWHSGIHLDKSFQMISFFYILTKLWKDLRLSCDVITDIFNHVNQIFFAEFY